MDYLVADTEDNSREIANARRKDRRNKQKPTTSFFDKKITQIAAINHKRTKYYDGPESAEPGKFLQWFSKRPERKCFFHNAGYDLGAFFVNDLDKIVLTMVGGRVIKAEWKDKVFVDSYNLFPVSVKKLGEAIGLKKLDFDSTDKAYVFRDCEIISEAIDVLLEAVEEFNITELPNTLGALCVEIWKQMGGENWKCVSGSIKNAIYGGRTEIFHRGGHGNFAMTDVNSMYPWALTQLYPAPMDPVDTLLTYGITACVMEIPRQPLGPLPFRQENGSIAYPTGYVSGTWTNHEIRSAIEHHGAKVKKLIWSVGTEEAFRYYKEFVTTFYEKRKEAKSEAFKFIYKILMNSFYGRLGMGGNILKSVPRSAQMIESIRKGHKQGTPYGNAILLQCAFPLPEQTNYVHAAYVTSYSRIRLMEFMRKVKHENLIYCDTDSLFFYAPDDTIPFQCSSALGDMKFEGFGDYIETHAPKMYQYRMMKNGQHKTRHKAKGVPRRKAARFMKDGEVTYEAPNKLRESILFYDRPALARPLSVWKDVTKSFNTKYDKKTLDGSRWLPHHLRIEAIEESIAELAQTKP